MRNDNYLVKNISNCELFELSCPKVLELIKMRGVGMLDNSDELKFDINIGDYGVSLIYHESEVSQPRSLSD